MGKGDKKTKKGKISMGSYGKKRPKKKKTSAIKPKKVEVKAKPKAAPKPEVKEKAVSKPKTEVKEKTKPKTEAKAKAAPKKAEPKAKPKKERELNNYPNRVEQLRCGYLSHISPNFYFCFITIYSCIISKRKDSYSECRVAV